MAHVHGIAAVVAQRAESPIKVVHIWMAVFVMALTFAGGIGVAVFKVGQWNGAVTERMDRQLEETKQLNVKLDRVASQSQESHDFILQNKQNIESLQPRPVPVFSQKGSSVQ